MAVPFRWPAANTPRHAAPCSANQICTRSASARPQHLCETLLTQSNVDAAARRRYIEWTDPEGRTPLCLAAQKNQYQAAQLVSAPFPTLAPTLAGMHDAVSLVAAATAS